MKLENSQIRGSPLFISLNHMIDFMTLDVGIGISWFEICITYYVNGENHLVFGWSYYSAHVKTYCLSTIFSYHIVLDNSFTLFLSLETKGITIPFSSLKKKLHMLDA